MHFTVKYDGVSWVFEVFSGEDSADKFYESFEIEELDDAVEQARELLLEVRDDTDPLAEIFDEDEF